MITATKIRKWRCMELKPVPECCIVRKYHITISQKRHGTFTRGKKFSPPYKTINPKRPFIVSVKKFTKTLLNRDFVIETRTEGRNKFLTANLTADLIDKAQLRF